MKTIGLLGGTGWSSTIGYYQTLNQLVNQKLGGYHSAKILLKSIDYHEIMSNYGKDHEQIAQILQRELEGLIALNPDCIMICCNSLHKYYDMIRNNISSTVPVFHAAELTAQYAREKNCHKVLLLATKFTMEDGFFAKILEENGINVVLPNPEERHKMQMIHDELMKNSATQESRNYFENLIMAHQDLDAVILGCTEYPLVVDPNDFALPIIDPAYLQAAHAVDYALQI